MDDGRQVMDDVEDADDDDEDDNMESKFVVFSIMATQSRRQPATNDPFLLFLRQELHLQLQPHITAFAFSTLISAHQMQFKF